MRPETGFYGDDPVLFDANIYSGATVRKVDLTKN
jgi:hypothetical protein